MSELLTYEPKPCDEEYGDEYEPYVLKEVTAGNTTVRLSSNSYGYGFEFVSYEGRGFNVLLDSYEYSALCDLFGGIPKEAWRDKPE